MPSPTDRSRRLLVAAGAMLGAGAVLLGAFGSHALDAVLSEAQQSTFETAVRYQIIHAVCLVALGLGADALRAHTAGLFMLSGVCLFSGSLYALVFTDLPIGVVTPIGGLLMIAGWVLLAAAYLRPPAAPDEGL